MSIWVRALCTTSVADITPEELRAGIAQRLPLLASLYGEDDEEATAARLRVEGDAPLGVWKIAYRGDETSIRLERWSEPAELKEEVTELLDGLADCDEDGVDEVRELLGKVVDSVALELKLSDCECIGWPVAIAAAACLAARGAGIVQADGEGWMLPRGRDVEHVLDGD